MEQRIAVLVSALFAIPLMLVFIAVARSAGSAGNPDDIASSAARWRRLTFWGLLVLFVPALALSLMRLPYPASGVTPDAVVEAKGTQWAWQLTPPAVTSGQLVEIRVNAADVNHGFAVYDSNNRLVIQTQAMPGYTNVLRHRFAEPGTYRILCLEYCGLGHHTMTGQLVVNERSTAVAGGIKP